MMINLVSKRVLIFSSLIFPFASCPYVIALDQQSLTGEFSLPDRSHNLVDSQDDYFDSVQRLQDADAAVVRARESIIKQQQSTPQYTAEVKAVDDAYRLFIEKRNASVADMEKKDPIYNQMKSQVSTVDAQIETARQNPGTTQEHFDELYKSRETFVHQWHQLEKDATGRAGLTPLWQHWVDASKKLADLQNKQYADAENNEKLKSAIAMADEAKSAVQQAKITLGGAAAAAKLTSAEQTRAGDFLCRYSPSGFAGNDAWWTYGWSGMGPGEKAPPISTSAPGK